MMVTKTGQKSASMRAVALIAMLCGASVQKTYGMHRLACMGGSVAAQAGVAAALATQMRSLVSGQEKHPFWVKISTEIQEFKKKHGIAPTQHELLKTTQEYPGTMERCKQAQKALGLRVSRLSSLCSSCEYHYAPMLEQIRIYKDLSQARKDLNALDSFLTRQAEFDATPETVEMKKIRALVAQIFEKHGIHRASVRFIVKDNPMRSGAMACVDNQDELSIFPLFMELTSQAKQQAILEHEACHIIHQDAAYRTWVHAMCSPRVLQDFELLIEKRADIHAGIQSLESAQHLPQSYATLYKLHQILQLSPKQDGMEMIRLCFAPNYMNELIAYWKQQQS